MQSQTRNVTYLSFNESEWTVQTRDGGLSIQCVNCKPTFLRYDEVKYWLSKQAMLLNIEGYPEASLSSCYALTYAMEQYLAEWVAVSEKLGFHKRKIHS